MKLLIEQKSGRNRKLESEGAARSGGPSYGKQIEKHYVQMLLYYGVLSRNFQIPRQQMQIMLLYSRYPLPQGLLEVEPLQKLLREAIALRNRIVANEYDMANGHFAEAIDQLTPETLNTLHLGGFFYERYLLPVWDFMGYDYNDEIDNSSQIGHKAWFSAQSLLTINAIDGSIIDRDAGY